MKLEHSSENMVAVSTIDRNNTEKKIAVNANVSSSVLQRLMREVKNDSVNNISAYNRTHNRHNRGR